jgi:hypothetical protein
MPHCLSIRLLNSLLLVSSLYFTVNSFAADDGTWTYYIDGANATVTGCVATCPQNLVIPETIDGYSVTSIGRLAFRLNQLTSVTIPDSVSSILNNAFERNQLTSVTIPDSVTSIGDSAFRSNQLTSVTIPDSVTSISAGVFNRNQLTSVTIPDSVTRIEQNSFSENQLTSVTIPDSVTSIGDSAFSRNLLISVTIPDGVTSVGKYTFSFNKLTSVTIPASVTSIEEYAFTNNQLTSVPIFDSVTSIGIGAFSFNRLTSVTIPDSVTSIGEKAFYFMRLTSVTIPDSVISIGNAAFRGDGYGQLTSVTIPDSVTSIGSAAFYANKLEIVQFLGDRPAIAVDAFNDNPLNSITYCSDTNGWPGPSIDNVTPVNDCDGDGVLDVADAFPLDATETLDTDGDLMGNNADADDDGDGILDTYELANGLDPVNVLDGLLDKDSDGLSNFDEFRMGTNIDLVDSDDDGINDNVDNNPLVFDEVAPTLYSGQLTVLPDVNDDAIQEIGILKVDGEEGQVTLDILNGQNQILIKTITWADTFEDSTLALHLIPDMDDNGADEVGLFGVQDTANNAGKPQMFVRDLRTGNRVSVYNWPSNWKEVSAMVLSDISGDGIPEIGLQGRFKDGNRPQLVVKNGSDGSSQGAYAYPNLFSSPMFHQHSDVDGDGFEEIATFGRISRNNKIQIKIASGINPGSKMKAYNFPDSWDDISWVRLDDSNGDGIDDWGLFGISKTDGRPQLINKDGTDPKGALRIYAWPSDMSNAQFYRIPDMNNDGVDEVAAAGRRSNGRYQFQVQDGVDRNSVLANHNLNLKLENLTYHVLPDLSGDEKAEIGFMGINTQGEYELVIRHGDTLNGEYATHNLGSDWQSAPEIASLGDTDDDGLPKLLIYGQNATGEQLVMTSL